MSIKEEARIFVGGLSWDTTGRQLQDVFSRFGKVLESEVDGCSLYVWTSSLGKHIRSKQSNREWQLTSVQVLRDRDTGRPRGFGFVTFADRRAMEDAIAEMHGQEIDGRSISVNKAEPKMDSDDRGYDHHRGGDGRYSSGGRGGYRGSSNDRPPPVPSSDCFRCGRPGHWARECPSAGGGSSRSRFSSGPSRSDHQYVDDRYDGGGRYGDRDRVDDDRDSRYSGGRDRYGSDRYSPGEDRYRGGGGGDKYHPRNANGKERGHDRDGPRSGGPIRYEGGSGYRERAVPYDRRGRGGHPPPPYDR